MAVTPQAFPPRKRRPSAGAFVSPRLSDVELVQSLLQLSQEIASLRPFQYLLRSCSLSIARKVNLLAVLFEELLRKRAGYCSPSAVLCFEEMYILLQRIKTLIEDCSNGSKMWLLLQVELVSDSFRELNADLTTSLDVFPVGEAELGDDVEELVDLIKNQRSRAGARVDPRDDDLRRGVLAMLDGIAREVVPDQAQLAAAFEGLGLRDSSSCGQEMESLEEEVQNQSDEKAKSQAIALIGLVRYAKCVLYGGSTPPKRPAEFRLRKSASSIAFPADFRCPITLDLMRDPVVVATGQTYDRESISLWIQSGHNTCPKTGQTLAHSDLIPNRALKNLISLWCREQKIPFEAAGDAARASGGGGARSKAAIEATKMTVSFLLRKLRGGPPAEVADGIVHELRALAKSDSESRAFIAEAGAIPQLVRYLGSDVASEYPSLQVNAITTILNLSILDANKARIMETDGALNGVIEVLRTGTTWEAKGNAAATIFSLSGVHSHMKRLGRKTRVVRGLMDLARDGHGSARRDALAAILNLAGDREAVANLLEEGMVEMVCDVMESLQDEAVTILEAVVKRGGLVAVAAAYCAIRKLGRVLREGSERARESAAATLVMICRKGGPDAVVELATMPGIERVIWELMGTGTGRAKRKAASLLRTLRRWAAGLVDGDPVDPDYTTNVTATRIMLPS
ncbi:U-box domain-containing protein 16 [Syzygium oleosum]|uniref:U-box domain-containing protein 16 n=1 Tax=Syzygium oleosum TaxID=219896 RepID=UPI0024BBB18E|nr:U-box domain-containing protein 16 [Syzygium oleosum]